MSPAASRKMQSCHPCFYAGAKGKYRRIHLPVAPLCNIQCSYCRRDYDCPNENRPGVSSGVISPEEALDRLERSLQKMPFLSVAAVAGPGDAFCDAERTLRTFELIRRKNSEIALCVSTNGLNVKDHVSDLRALGIRFMTITVNAIDPKIGMRLYRWVDIEGTVKRGTEAVEILISRQLEAISLLKAANITVKVNSVVVPGVNDDHLLFVARKMNGLKVDLMNLIPLIPLAGTDLEGIDPPGEERLRKLRLKAGVCVPQMRHCTRCRSDSIGLL